MTDTSAEVSQSPTSGQSPTVTPLRELERREIVRALQVTRNEKREAAALLGISLKTLYNKLHRYGLFVRSRTAAGAVAAATDGLATHSLRR